MGHTRLSSSLHYGHSHRAQTSRAGMADIEHAVSHLRQLECHKRQYTKLAHATWNFDTSQPTLTPISMETAFGSLKIADFFQHCGGT